MTDEEKAEEYKESKRLHCIPKERYIIEEQESRLTEIKQAFLAGLNKAKEWHYVKDGKLNDVIDTWDKKRKYLIMVRFTNNLGKYDEIPLLAYCSHPSEKWCTSKLDYLNKFYITWWKEIVLPKEEIK